MSGGNFESLNFMRACVECFVLEGGGDLFVIIISAFSDHKSFEEGTIERVTVYSKSFYLLL